MLEGLRLVADAISAGAQPEFVLYTTEAASRTPALAGLVAELDEHGVPCLEVAPAVMAHAADTQTPQGLIAVVPTPVLPITPDPTLVLILDGIADPGNMGTLLRTAAAAGVDGVVLAPNCVDAYNPKALRGGMGAHFRVPVIARKWEQIMVEFGHLPAFLAEADGAQIYHGVDWRKPAALIIGGEARGAEAAVQALTVQTVAIPMANAAESLNAAIAAAVILFEIRRQRG